MKYFSLGGNMVYFIFRNVYGTPLEQGITIFKGTSKGAILVECDDALKTLAVGREVSRCR